MRDTYVKLRTGKGTGGPPVLPPPPDPGAARGGGAPWDGARQRREGAHGGPRQLPRAVRRPQARGQARAGTPLPHLPALLPPFCKEALLVYL